MFGTLLKLGALGDSIKGLEQTETGKFTLHVAKFIVIAILVTSVLVIFFTVRTVNKTFSSTKRDVDIMKSQMLGMRNENILKDENEV